MNPHSTIMDVARSCSVRICAADGRLLGSGFFVDEGLVLTCAHVVRSAAEVTVQWGGHEVLGVVESTLPSAPGSGAFWPFPDVAVVRLTLGVPHPIGWLDQSEAVRGDTLQAFGFRVGGPQPGVAVSELRLTCAGSEGSFVRATHDRVVEGLSGSMLVNMRTGVIAGMMKGSVDKEAVAGGYYISSVDIVRVLASQLRGRLGSRPPGDGWLQALIAPMRPMLAAQRESHRVLPFLWGEGENLPLLQDVYVRPAASSERRTRVDVGTVFSQHRHLLLVGSPGSGKTSLVDRVAAATAKWWIQPQSTAPFGEIIPIPVTAANIASQRWLPDLIRAAIGPMSPGSIPDPLSAPIPWMILVDGLDEVLDPTLRLALTQRIHGWIDEHGDDCSFVVTTRPLADRELGAIAVSAMASYTLCEFSPQMLDDFSRRWFTARGLAHADADAQASSFIDSVAAASLSTLVQIPLLATMAVVIWESDPARGLPRDLASLYRAFFHVLQVRREQRGVHQRLAGQLQPMGAAGQRLLRLLTTEIEELLVAIAFRWFFEREHDVITIATRWLLTARGCDIHAVVDGTSILRVALRETGLLVERGGGLHWMHLSFAEFFASTHLAKQGNPREWAWLGADYTTQNLGQLALSQRLRRTPSAAYRTLRALAADPRSAATLRTLLAAQDVVSDTTIARLVRRWRPGAGVDLTPFWSREAGQDAIRRTATSRWELFDRRRHAAMTLLNLGNNDEQFAAAFILRRMLTRTRLRPERHFITAIGILEAPNANPRLKRIAKSAIIDALATLSSGSLLSGEVEAARANHDELLNAIFVANAVSSRRPDQTLIAAQLVTSAEHLLCLLPQLRSVTRRGWPSPTRQQIRGMLRHAFNYFNGEAHTQYLEDLRPLAGWAGSGQQSWRRDLLIALLSWENRSHDDLAHSVAAIMGQPADTPSRDRELRHLAEDLPRAAVRPLAAPDPQSAGQDNYSVRAAEFSSHIFIWMTLRHSTSVVPVDQLIEWIGQVPESHLGPAAKTVIGYVKRQPRSGRTILLAFAQRPDLKRRHRRRIEKMLQLLGGPPEPSTAPTHNAVTDLSL